MDEDKDMHFECIDKTRKWWEEVEGLNPQSCIMDWWTAGSKHSYIVDDTKKNEPKKKFGIYENAVRLDRYLQKNGLKGSIVNDRSLKKNGIKRTDLPIELIRSNVHPIK